MRGRFEFAFHSVNDEDTVRGEVDPTLALMGAQGWEIRGLTATPGGTVVVALQRPLGEELPLPDASTLSEALAEPLAAPAGID